MMMLQIQKGYMCVEGDNKEKSRDSREYGPVPMGLTDGKVVFRVSVAQRRKGVNVKVVSLWKYISYLFSSQMPSSCVWIVNAIVIIRGFRK